MAPATRWWCCTGGPGFPSDYLAPLAALGDERAVVLYDQLGCGRSGRPIDPGLWRLERFLAELQQVLSGLSLPRYHLLGHSWGAMLALDHALARPSGLRSLILASPPLSVRRWLADAARYRAALPEAFPCGPGDPRSGRDARRRSLCRGDGRLLRPPRLPARPRPPPLQRAREGAGEAVYRAMWGPNEFVMEGNLSDYERADRLPELALPTLFTCGRYDEASPEATALYADLVPGAQVGGVRAQRPSAAPGRTGRLPSCAARFPGSGRAVRKLLVGRVCLAGLRGAEPWCRVIHRPGHHAPVARLVCGRPGRSQGR